MRSDDVHQALREIERRFRWERPELDQLFDTEDPSPPAITGCLLLGPRVLTDAEIRSLQRAPEGLCFASRRVD